MSDGGYVGIGIAAFILLVIAGLLVQQRGPMMRYMKIKQM